MVIRYLFLGKKIPFSERPVIFAGAEELGNPSGTSGGKPHKGGIS
jgi:hypothetical protein